MWRVLLWYSGSRHDWRDSLACDVLTGRLQSDWNERVPWWSAYLERRYSRGVQNELPSLFAGFKSTCDICISFSSKYFHSLIRVMEIRKYPSCSNDTSFEWLSSYISERRFGDVSQL